MTGSLGFGFRSSGAKWTVERTLFAFVVATRAVKDLFVVTAVVGLACVVTLKPVVCSSSSVSRRWRCFSSLSSAARCVWYACWLFNRAFHFGILAFELLGHLEGFKFRLLLIIRLTPADVWCFVWPSSSGMWNGFRFDMLRHLLFECSPGCAFDCNLVLIFCGCV